MRRIFTLIFALLTFAQHQSKAQTICDSLDIQVAYSPFYDSLIEIRVWNNSSYFFNYPAFVLYDNNGDTVAKEQLNLFGIAQASVHSLNVFPGSISNPSFSGTLELYTDNFDSLHCSFAQNFDLCPTGCQQAIFYLGNFGGAGFIGDVSYEVRNINAQVVESGMLTIDMSQYDADTMCLMPGDYTLHLSNITLTSGGAKGYGLTKDSATYPQLSWTHNDTTDTSFSFSFYSQCAPISSVPEVPGGANQLVTAVADGQLYLRNLNGTQIGQFSLYTIDGKRILEQHIAASQQTVDVSAFAPGIYILHTLQKGKLNYNKIVIH